MSDELWTAAKRVTTEQGETVTDVIVRALDRYVRSRGLDVDPVTALERLARLHAVGGITDDEWRTKRQDLLGRI